jgi:hypothetical protein
MNVFNKIKAAGGELVRVEEETVDYALGVLPPVRGNKCFAMGEVFRHDAGGEPTYFWFARLGEFWYGLLGTQAAAETRFAKSRGWLRARV